MTEKYFQNAKRILNSQLESDEKMYSELLKGLDINSEEFKKTLLEERVKRRKRSDSKRKLRSKIKQKEKSKRNVFQTVRKVNYTVPSFIKEKLGIKETLINPLLSLRTITDIRELQTALRFFIEALKSLARYPKRKLEFEKVRMHQLRHDYLLDNLREINETINDYKVKLTQLGINWNIKSIDQTNVEEIIDQCTKFYAEIHIYNLIIFYLDLWKEKYDELHRVYMEYNFEKDISNQIKSSTYPELSLFKEHIPRIQKIKDTNNRLLNVLQEDVRRVRKLALDELNNSVENATNIISNLNIKRDSMDFLQRIITRTDSIFQISKMFRIKPQNKNKSTLKTARVPILQTDIRFDIHKEWEVAIKELLSN